MNNGGSQKDKAKNMDIDDYSHKRWYRPLLLKKERGRELDSFEDRADATN